VIEISDSMTAVCSIDREFISILLLPVLFDVLADDVAHLSVHSARFICFEGFLKTIVAIFDEDLLDANT
jgi:hypothetical protein